MILNHIVFIFLQLFSQLSVAKSNNDCDEIAERVLRYEQDLDSIVLTLTPVDDQFKIDHRLDLGRKWLEGNKRTQILVDKLGFEPKKIELSDGKKAVVLKGPPLSEFIRRYYSAIEEIKRIHNFSDEDVIRPALTYKSKDLIDMEDVVVMIRPGIDPKPSTDLKQRWLYVDQHQISHSRWTHAMSNGQLPFSTSAFSNHDVAHLVEFLENPQLMKETRQFYKHAQSIERDRRKLLRKEMKKGQSRGRVKKSPEYLAIAKKIKILAQKAYFFGEFLSLANNRKKRIIKKSLKHIFNDPRRQSFDGYTKYLNELNQEELIKRVQTVRKLSQKVLLNHGGALSDSFNPERFIEIGINRVRDFIVAIEEYQEGLKNKFEKFGYMPPRDPKLTYLFYFHTPTLVSSVITELSDGLRKTTAEGIFKDKIRNELIEYIARFDLALFHAVDLDIKPEDIIAESANPNFNPNSKVANYFRGHLSPNDDLHKIFAENDIPEASLYE